MLGSARSIISLVMAQINTSKFGFTCVVTLIVLFRCSYAATARDTISIGQKVTLSNNITSAGNVFELGVFLPSSNASETANFYVGIWYKEVSSQEVVWVANRDFPFTSASAVLTISNDGNLVIMDGKVRYMVSNVSANNNTSATLFDSGNLVLKDENSNVLWQSFDFPTHTLLPGMKFGYDKSTGKNWSLVSWKTPYDPSPGDFSLMLDPIGTTQFYIMKGTQIYWTSGAWNGQFFSLVPQMNLNYLFNFSYVINENMSYITYSLYNTSIISKLLIDVNGQIKQVSWLQSSQQWSQVWAQPIIQCEVYGYCGAYATCKDTAPFCECLRGFEPRDPSNWAMEVYYGGCTRKASLRCVNSSLADPSDDRFLSTRNALADNPLITIGQNIQDCESTCLNDCNCTAFAQSNNNCSTWQGDLINLKELNKTDTERQDLYIRLAASEFSTTNSSVIQDPKGTGGNKRDLLIITTSTVSFMILVSFVLICWMRKRKRGEKGEDLLSFDFSVKPGASKYELTEGTGTIKGKKEVEIPIFSFSSVSTATDHFSVANKLGQGGFGPVYKGKLLNGHEVAVKRLSRRSRQGLEELKNEAMLIAKLQHKNLVKLLGCCIEGEEKILIYEYLPNKSLDLFLFGRAKHGLLDWGTRVRIIEGIAQGLLYLHQFSRLQIIHRDLKASNILLDKNMNPKISDFGMARIFDGQESQATNRIVET